jgi:crossover junction endodeoxyribonuclease RusA
MGKVKLKNDLYRTTATNPSKKLHFSLPLPPSVNHMYVNTRYGGKRLTRVAEAYIPVSRAMINVAIDEQRWIKQEESTWYYVDLVFYFPDRKIRDSHNMLKMLLDVMQGIVFDNDYYALPRIHSVEYDKVDPRVEVVVSPQTRIGRNKGLAIINR